MSDTLRQRAEQLAIEIYTHVDDAGDWGVYEITPVIHVALQEVVGACAKRLRDQADLSARMGHSEMVRGYLLLAQEFDAIRQQEAR